MYMYISIYLYIYIYIDRYIASDHETASLQADLNVEMIIPGQTTKSNDLALGAS